MFAIIGFLFGLHYSMFKVPYLFALVKEFSLDVLLDKCLLDRQPFNSFGEISPMFFEIESSVVPENLRYFKVIAELLLTKEWVTDC